MQRKWTWNDNGFGIEMLFEDVECIQGCKLTLTDWLESDVQASTYFLEQITQILNGVLPEDEYSGNAYDITIGKNFSTIRYIFEEETSANKPCKVPTPLLREIIEVWLEEREKYYANKK